MNSQASHDTSSSSDTANIRRSSEQNTVLIFGEKVLEDLGYLCMNELYSDVSFFVEGQILPAHRMILAARSEYFRAMLYGDKSTERQVKLEAPLEAFKAILGYLYSRTLPTSTMDADTIFKVLGLSNLYGLSDAESALAKHLEENLAVSNACPILDTARKFNLAGLTMKRLKFMDKNASQLMQQDSFQMLSKESLEEVLRRDTFAEEELNIFQAVLKWSRHNQGVDIKSVVTLVRLSLITPKDLVTRVRHSGIVDTFKILDAMEKQIITSNLRYRAHVSPSLPFGDRLGYQAELLVHNQ